MGTTLHTLAPNPGATRNRKRIGRGVGSGNGKTAGRGQKGQKARAGHHGARVGFEGGQMPMQRRLPKRGFKNPFRVEAFPVNLGVLEARFGDDAVIDIEAMRKAGLVPKKASVIKVLGEGELGKKLTVKAHRFSKSAIAKLEAAGGSAEIVEVKKTAKSVKQGDVAE
jgi:large subunit ribosomal protein L15